MTTNTEGRFTDGVLKYPISFSRYERLIGAFEILKEGGSQPFNVVFPTSDQFAASVAQTLIEARIVSWGGGQMAILDRRIFSSIWDDERNFCALGNWDDAHAYQMNILLRGGSLREECAAIATICRRLHNKTSGYPSFPSRILARRLGRGQTTIDLLRTASRFPEQVLVEMERRGMKTNKVLAIRKGASEEEMLLIVKKLAPTDEERMAEELHRDDEEQDVVDQDAVVAMTLKVVTGMAETQYTMFETINRIENRLEIICRELGIERKQ